MSCCKIETAFLTYFQVTSNLQYVIGWAQIDLKIISLLCFATASFSNYRKLFFSCLIIVRISGYDFFIRQIFDCKGCPKGKDTIPSEKQYLFQSRLANCTLFMLVIFISVLATCSLFWAICFLFLSLPRVATFLA